MNEAKRARKVQPAQLASKGQPVQLENLAQLVHRGFKGRKDLQEAPGHKAQLAYKDLQGLPVRKDHKDLKARQAKMGLEG